MLLGAVVSVKAQSGAGEGAEEVERREERLGRGHRALREGIRAVCARFPAAYWRECDRERRYPEAFVETVTEGGYLAVLIPQEFGGAGGTLEEAAVILEEINASGGNGAACHAQMYTMGTLLRHGSASLRARHLPAIAAGHRRLQAFGVTEPGSGSDAGRLTTTATRDGDDYVINGQKIWTSRVQHSDLMLVLARTGVDGDVHGGGRDGLSVFVLEVADALEHGMSVRPIRTMLNHETNEVFFSNLRVPVENMVGEPGRGFEYILDSLNAERILIAAECVGDGRWLIDQSVAYARNRVVFGRPIGSNQGVAFPLALGYARLCAADQVRRFAAARFDAGLECGEEANMAKLLAAEASWECANAALQTHGGFGFAEELDIERKFRETRLYQVAPISTNLILAYVAQHVLGLPRSY